MPYKDPQKKRENAKKYAAKYPERLRATRHRCYLKNKETICKQTLAYYHKNKERVSKRIAARYIERNYGLNRLSFIKLLESQNGKCKICNRDLRLSGKIGDDKFNIDHDHTCCSGSKSCGKCIRAILCGNCNLGIGAMKDNSDLLRTAADYLDSYNARK